MPRIPRSHPASMSYFGLTPKRLREIRTRDCSASSMPVELRSKRLPVAVARERPIKSTPERPLSMRSFPVMRSCERTSDTPLPAYLVEANYEFESLQGPVTTAPILRRQEYWTLLSGAAGQLVQTKRYVSTAFREWRSLHFE